jgi:hypothetical protein
MEGLLLNEARGKGEREKGVDKLPRNPPFHRNEANEDVPPGTATSKGRLHTKNA